MTTGTTDVAEAQAAVDASLKAPTVGARRWAGRGPAERRRLLLATHRAVGDAAADWVRAACAIKGIDERLAGEEWSTGPYAVLTALDAYADTLQALRDGRSPVDGFDIVDAAGGRRAVRVLPQHRDGSVVAVRVLGRRVVRAGRRGRADPRIRRAGPAGPDPHRGSRGGAGRRQHHRHSAAGRAVRTDRALPSRAGPVEPDHRPAAGGAAARVRPTDRVDVLRIHADGGLGPYLVGHRGVDHLHLTGSGATHDAVVHGSAERKVRGDKAIRTPVTVELGGVSPTIVAPGGRRQRRGSSRLTRHAADPHWWCVPGILAAAVAAE